MKSFSFQRYQIWLINMKPKATTPFLIQKTHRQEFVNSQLFKMATVTIATEGLRGDIYFCNQKQNQFESLCAKTYRKNIFILCHANDK